MKIRYLPMVAALLVAVLLFPGRTMAISAQRAIVIDGTTGRILYEKDANTQSLIASTTKIMTALVVCEQCNVLDRMRIPKEAVGIEGSSLYLKEGEVLTVQELLYGLMLHSGNDAAVALAIYCGGTMEGFVHLMNDKAASLGLTNTHFENPHGLDSPGHYSSAKDLAVLASYAMDNPIFAKTVSTKTVRIGERSLRNHNKLLWRVDGVDGVKTGYTMAAGRILVSSAQRQGRRLIAVTINDGNDWNDHEKLLADGFTNYSVRQVIEAGETIGTVAVFGGCQDQVELKAQQEFFYSVSDSEQPYILLSPPGFVYAPVTEGQCAGYAYVCIGDTTVGKIPLEYADTVEQLVPVKRSLWERLFGGKGS